MKTKLLFIALPLAATIGCSQGAKEDPEPKVISAIEEPRHREVQARAPEGFPLATMEGDEVQASQSFAREGGTTFEVHLRAKADLDAVVAHWKNQLLLQEIVAEPQAAHGEGYRRFVLEGTREDGVQGRIGVLQGDPTGDGESPVEVSVLWGRG